MIPGPITQSPASTEVLLLDNITHYANRSAYRAANPSAPELGPCDPSRPIVDYDMTAVPPEFRAPNGGVYTIDLAKNSVDAIPYEPLNLPNDNLTFPAWENSPTTPARVQANPPTPATGVNAANLCTQAEAQFVVGTLRASGFSASDPADSALTDGGSYEWNGEPRRPWSTVIQDYPGSFFCAPLYEMIADKAQGNAGGVDAPGKFTDSAGNGLFHWTPQPAPTSTLPAPCRPLVPPEQIQLVQVGLSYQPMLTLGTPAPAASTGSGLSAADEAALQEIPQIEKELEALLEAERIPIPPKQ